MGLKNFVKRAVDYINEHTLVDDLEANLYPPNSGMIKKSRGELEFERYKPGHMAFEVEIKKSAGIPAGEEAAILIHGVEACRVTMTDAYETKLRLKTKDGDEVPPIQEGDEAQVVYNGDVILVGKFKKDD